MDLEGINNITKDMCKILTASKSLAVADNNNGRIPSSGSCNWTPVVALVIAFIGIITNIVNIAVFSNNLRNQIRVQILFLALAVADFLLLASQIPHLVVVLTGQSKYQMSNLYSNYLITRYTSSYICICVAAWILVAMVIYEFKYKEELTEEQFGSELVLDSIDEGLSKKRYSKDSIKVQVTIVSLICLIAVLLHIIKSFEFHLNYNQNRPYRLTHRPMLDHIWYEIFSLIVSLGLTFIFPFVFHVVAAIYLFIRIILMKLPGRFRSENITQFYLYFVLSFVYCACYIYTICQQIRQIVFHDSNGPCHDKIAECLIFLYSGIKCVPYLCFNDMAQDVRSFKAQHYFSRQVSMQPPSVGFVPSQVFENPIFKGFAKGQGDGENTTL